MRWDTVLRAVRTAVLEDAALRAIYGDAVRLSGSAEVYVPLLELTLISDVERETEARVVVQFDQWLGDLSALQASERRLRQLFHRETPATIGGVVMWALYVDGDSIGKGPGVAPNRDNDYGRAIRFEFGPLRERYDARDASPAPPSGGPIPWQGP